MNELETLKKIILFVKNDLNLSLNAGVNISLAMLVSAYTEIFGSLLTNEKTGRDRYEGWLKYMGSPYSDLVNRWLKFKDPHIDLYSRIRCGLIHESTVKGGARIFIADENAPAPGIELKDHVININNRQYVKDFLTSVDRYLDEVQCNEELMKNLKASRESKPSVI